MINVLIDDSFPELGLSLARHDFDWIVDDLWAEMLGLEVNT